MPDITNQPVNPYPQPTEKLEDREMHPFAGPFRAHRIVEAAYDGDQLALDLAEHGRRVPRYEKDA